MQFVSFFTRNVIKLFLKWKINLFLRRRRGGEFMMKNSYVKIHFQVDCLIELFMANKKHLFLFSTEYLWYKRCCLLLFVTYRYLYLFKNVKLIIFFRQNVFLQKLFHDSNWKKNELLFFHRGGKFKELFSPIGRTCSIRVGEKNHF